MVLRWAEGVPNKVVAAELDVVRRMIGKWCRRFPEDRLDEPSDGFRSGRTRTVGDDRVAYVVGRTLHTTPSDATHRSTRSMAGESGLSQTTVRRIRNTLGLQPHRAGTFKLSGDSRVRGQDPRHRGPVPVADGPGGGAPRR